MPHPSTLSESARTALLSVERHARRWRSALAGVQDARRAFAQASLLPPTPWEIELQARKRRIGEARAREAKLALEREIVVAIDTTDASLTQSAEAAGLSRSDIYAVIEREDIRGRRRAR